METKIYDSILNKKQCKSISNAMFDLQKQNKLIKESDDYYYNSYGFYNLPEAVDMLSYVQPIVRKDYPEIRFENSYTRIYQNGSILKYHTDRSELYLTLSVCVYSDIETDWPLCVSKIPYAGAWNGTISFEIFAQDYDQFVTPVGSGVTVKGTTWVHWRNPLECKPNQKVIQTFFHWNRI